MTSTQNPEYGAPAECPLSYRRRVLKFTTGIGRKGPRFWYLERHLVVACSLHQPIELQAVWYTMKR
jgi:hypothetical protein